MSWAREAVAAICKIILIEDGIEGRTDLVKLLADCCRYRDRRRVHIEAKFALIEKIATGSSRCIFREKSES